MSEDKIKEIWSDGFIHFIFDDDENLVQIKWFIDSDEVNVNGEFVKFEKIPENIAYQVLGACRILVSKEAMKINKKEAEAELEWDKIRESFGKMIKDAALGDESS